MAEMNTARQNARSAAEGKAAGSKASTAAPKSETKTKPTPAPRDETSNNTTETHGQEAAPAPKVDIPLIVVCPNPKRAGSIAARHFAMYGETGKLTTHREALARGVRGKDVSWDSDKTRCHILIDDITNGKLYATDYAALETNEQRVEFLRKYSDGHIKDATLIKWGLMAKPEPAPAAEQAPAGGQEANDTVKAEGEKTDA